MVNELYRMGIYRFRGCLIYFRSNVLFFFTFYDSTSDCTTVTLVGKERIDGKTVRTYDQAKTPYRRVKAMDSLPIEVNARLSAQYVQLNPVLLRANIDEKVGRLWKIVR